MEWKVKVRKRKSSQQKGNKGMTWKGKERNGNARQGMKMKGKE
jgi:hypothetical protein